MTKLILTIAAAAFVSGLAYANDHMAQEAATEVEGTQTEEATTDTMALPEWKDDAANMSDDAAYQDEAAHEASEEGHSSH